jgi:zinc D-Ala-D-Ala dipeptidase
MRKFEADDMGTAMTVHGHTASASITPSQHSWGNLPVAVMVRQGFVNYSKQWWHFSMPGAGGPAYDFRMKPRHD